MEIKAIEKGQSLECFWCRHPNKACKENRGPCVFYGGRETRYLSVLPVIISPGKTWFSGVLLPLDLSGP